MYWIPTCGRSGKGCSAVPCFGRASLIPPVADAPGWYGPDPTKLKPAKTSKLLGLIPRVPVRQPRDTTPAQATMPRRIALRMSRTAQQSAFGIRCPNSVFTCPNRSVRVTVLANHIFQIQSSLAAGTRHQNSHHIASMPELVKGENPLIDAARRITRLHLVSRHPT